MPLKPLNAPMHKKSSSVERAAMSVKDKQGSSIYKNLLRGGFFLTLTHNARRSTHDT